MAILQVAELGQPVLRKVALRVPEEDISDPGFQNFLDDLIESMRFHDGVGLAAVQVFRSQRVIAVEVPAEMDPEGSAIEATVFINPELTFEGSETEEGWEGCLSLRDLRGLVPRQRTVMLRAVDRQGQPVQLKLTGLPARVVQHEVDHLDGIVFLDRMCDLSSLVFAKELQRQPESNDHA